MILHELILCLSPLSRRLNILEKVYPRFSKAGSVSRPLTDVSDWGSTPPISRIHSPLILLFPAGGKGVGRRGSVVVESDML